MVITESAIDALSYAELHPNCIDNTRFISMGRVMSNKQKPLIAVAMAKIQVSNSDKIKNDLPRKIILATDNDEAGNKLASELEVLATTVVKSDVPIVRTAPQTGKDWNDVLRKSENLL